MDFNQLKNAVALTFIFSALLFSCASRKNKKSATTLKAPTTEVVKVEDAVKIEDTAVTRLPPPIVVKIEEPVKKEVVEAPLRVNLPAVPREFRGAWVATVANINWPTKNNFSTEQQKKEAINLLDFLKDHNFNAVVFQVRPSADALYESSYEPWSYFLTGEIGKRPNPYYDPLAFWIEEAHKRGLELHVGLNPYRAHHLSGGTVSNEAMVKKSPSNMVRLKNGMYRFDPASIKTQDHGASVVREIVARDDIAAVHFDDYF